MKRTRQKHSGTFKTKVVLEALQEREPIAVIAQKYSIHPVQIARWKKEFIERAPHLFDRGVSEPIEQTDVEKLYAKIGQLEMERDFLKKNLLKLGL